MFEWVKVIDLILLISKIAAFVVVLKILHVERLKRSEWQQMVIDATFGLLAFVGYIQVIQLAAGIGFGNSFLHLWALDAADVLAVRAFLAEHNILAFIVFALWTTYFSYWTHRMYHKVEAFWEIHKVHHSATRMTGLSQFRVHPFEELAMSYIGGVLITLLLPEIGGRSAVQFGFLLMVHNTLVHSEWRTSWGRWSWILTSPLAHQVHHSINPKHFNSNYGSPFIFWDRLHGTYVDPLKSEAPTAFGVDGVEPTDLRSLFIDPVVRAAQRLLTPIRRPALRRIEVKD